MSDLVADAAAELYRADPDEFMLRRTALAKAARSSGNPDAARRIAAFRKPTRAAWLLNRLARGQPEVPAQLAELASGLRDAERALDGARLRELSEVRSALIDEFTSRALADVADPPSALREDVSATLGAAIADPSVAADLEAGTLTRAVHWAGFGTPAGFDGPAPETKTDKSGMSAQQEAPVRAPGRGPARAPTRAPTRPREPGRPPPPHREGAEPAKPPRAARTSALREAEVRNQRRQQIQDAERGVANASTITSSAEANEERLEEVVRDLEQRLTTARAELSEARLRARRAETAERKARQALDRLRRSEK